LAKHYLHSGEGDLDFLLFGIVCQENQYRALSLLDDALGIELALSEYLPFELKHEKVFTFSLYYYHDEEFGIEYFFIPNASNYPGETATVNTTDLFSEVDVEERVKLIKELPQTDYFLIAKGEHASSHRHKIMSCLKKVTGFSRVQSVEPADLPSSRNLIF
jgi:hypothetical protein